MARSTYVYVVEGTPDGGYFWSLRAAFTVKHELIRWLRQRDSSDLMVTRLSDGAHAEPKVMDIEELLSTECRQARNTVDYKPCILPVGHPTGCRS